MAILSVDEIKVGDSYSEKVHFDEEKVRQFVWFSEDSAGIHVDRSFSEQKGFDNLVVHGLLLSVQFSRILGMELPGENTVIGNINLEFHSPVYVGDTVEFLVTVRRVLKPLGTILLDLKVRKTDGELCIVGKTVCAFKGYGRSTE